MVKGSSDPGPGIRRFRWPLVAAALLLGGTGPGCVTAAWPDPTATAAPEIRVLVYNIHAGKDAGGRENLAAVAELVRTTRAEPGSATIERMRAAGWTDAWEACGEGDGFTFSTETLVKRIDYLFLAPGLTCTRAEVPSSPASDHRPLLVMLRESP